uniref:Peptidyl-tRNA hydrolase 1 homolog n=1 Tax=Nomascus leucogenys TaxID=61853 RepID=A0A2I3H8D7_NOMLE
MRPRGFLGAGQRLSRAMSRCVLEPRPPGKRWMVSGVGRRRRGSPSLASVRPLCPGSRVPPNYCSVFLTGLAWTHRQQQQQQHHHHHHQWLSPHCPGSASCLHRHYRREQSHLSGSCGKRSRVDLTPGVLMLKSVLLTTLAFCFLRNKCLVSFRGGCTGPQQSLLSPTAWTRASGKAQCLAATHRPGFRMAQLVLHALGCFGTPCSSKDI